MYIVRLQSAIQRLVTRFRLEGGGETFFAPLVVPVTLIDEVLIAHGSTRAVLSLTATADTFVSAMTVPAGKIRKLKWVWKAGSAGSVATAIRRAGIAYELGTHSTSEVGEPCEITLNQGDEYGNLSSGNAGDGAKPTVCHWEEQDAF